MSRLPGSFRDPGGFLFTRGGRLYRQINQASRDDYDHLLRSGLYDRLVRDGLLIPHTEVPVEAERPELAYRVIAPEPIDFISYPYEWSFSQLKDAALATLAIQKLALEHGASLKDASAYNVQFRHGRPVLIDTLSFEEYAEGRAWTPYRQFCQHFLAPLSLMAFRDVRLGQLSRVHLDGVPLDLASRLLPWRTRFRPSLLLHVHAHAAAQRRYAARARPIASRRFSRSALIGLVDNLATCVARLSWTPGKTTWSDYYRQATYSPAGFDRKRRLIGDFLDATRPGSLWDLGANTGSLSREASARGIPTIAFDQDPGAVDLGYREGRSQGARHFLPLVLDLTNPSPAQGFRHHERMSLLDRGPADAVMALALVHHLAIANNLPLDKVAAFLRAATRRWLIVEFVPKTDPQVQRLLSSREDIFPGYTVEGFEATFAEAFEVRRVEGLPDSSRRLYLMERRA